jgi:hypothetical protein
MVDIRSNQNEDAAPEIHLFCHQIRVDKSNMAQVAMALFTVYQPKNARAGHPTLFMPELYEQFNKITSGVSDSLFFVLVDNQGQLNG